ncbi:hypothetical protein KSP39_PZI010903 [Platanthera zijinensis]|uniref:YLP motif-containing protein 1 n=1 Tax=Platanthera zijinensis TaxID=2320716 RepID=A0AAP0G5G3_9ASPA
MHRARAKPAWMRSKAAREHRAQANPLRSPPCDMAPTSVKSGLSPFGIKCWHNHPPHSLPSLPIVLTYTNLVNTYKNVTLHTDGWLQENRKAGSDPKRLGGGDGSPRAADELAFDLASEGATVGDGRGKAAGSAAPLASRWRPWGSGGRAGALLAVTARRRLRESGRRDRSLGRAPAAEEGRPARPLPRPHADGRGDGRRRREEGASVIQILMDNSWHFRPISDHQLCPVCFIPHYPFCLQPTTFAGDNYRFFSDLRSSQLQRPFHNQSHPPPFLAPPLNEPAPLQPPFLPPPFLHDEAREMETFRKRMRMEDPVIGILPPFEPFRTLSVENERRLNLIRSHGREGTALVQDGHQWNNTSDHRIDRHIYDFVGKHFSSCGIDHELPESEFDHRHDYSQSNAYEGNRNQPIYSLDREDRFIHNDRRGFEPVEFEQDRRRMFDPQIGNYYPYDRSAQFDKKSLKTPFHKFEESLCGSENFIPSSPRESFLKDSYRPASYSTNDDKLLGVGNFHDKQQSHTLLSTFPPLPTDHYRPEHRHQNHAIQNEMERKSEFYNMQVEEPRASFHHWPPIPVEIHKSLDSQAYPAVEQLDFHTGMETGYAPAYPSVSLQPLFPIQADASFSHLQVSSSVSATVSVASSVGGDTLAKRKVSSQGSRSLPQDEFHNEPHVQTSNGFSIEGSPFIPQSLSKLDEQGASFPVKHSWEEKPTHVDASHLFKLPHRASRPDHIVIILRGLPGSGKSYLAKALRDIEVENGGSAPRIHAMDDYFMMEVEKVEDKDGFKSSSSVRSKKQMTKKVIEYCYEPEMEEAYRSSMLKAFKKTLDDGIFNLVIVDDRNLRVADFAQFWAIAKRSRFEVYLLDATYKDPAGCAARNIHGFKLADIEKMARQWEEAPPLYLHLNIQSLFGGDDSINHSILEVDMDADDTSGDGEANQSEETDGWTSNEVRLWCAREPLRRAPEACLGHIARLSRAEKNDPQESKWSKDLSVNLHDSKSTIANASALSGLIQAYGKDAKFIHWGDKVETNGFSIGANRKQSASSLIIGPGAGYNLKSNPLPEENPVAETTVKASNDTKRRIYEQLRAERESFRAIFERRRHRVGGLWDADDE